MSTDILKMAASGEAGNVLREMRVRSLFSPYYLCKVVLGYKDLVKHLHYHDSEWFIQRWLGGCRKQWIEWPRGFFKSTQFTIGTSIWIACPVSEEDTDYALSVLGIDEVEWFARAALHDQDVTQLLAFETIDNAIKKIKEIRWHFESNQIFRLLFPEIAYTGSEDPWHNSCLKIRRVGYGRRLEEGTFEAIGVGGALQSRHYKIAWEDDLVGKKAVESDAVMTKTIHWHGLLHGAFENAAQQVRFGVSNRWGYNDLNSYIRLNEPDFMFYSRSAIEIDSETGQEVSIFPERYPLEALYRIRDSGGMSRYDFSCQYLNKPIMPGEQELDPSKIHYYTVEADGRVICSCGCKYYPSQLNRYMHYDPYNAKGVDSKSRPAVVIIGIAPNNHKFLLDTYLARGSYQQVFDKLFSLAAKWRPYLMTYEDVGAQNMTEFYIRDRLRKATERPYFPQIRAIPTKNKAKEVRIRDWLFPVLRAGEFSIRREQTTLLEQLDTFPNPVFDHDYDLLDCLAQGTQVWRKPFTDEELSDCKAVDVDLQARLGKPYTFLEYRT